MIESLLFETLFDIIPFGVYVVDVENNRIIYMNRILRERFGDKPADPCWKVVYQQDQKCDFCKIPDLLDERGRPNGETVVFANFNEAEDRWFQLLEKAVSWPDGRIVKYSIAVDITELKETQNKLAEAHALLALKNKELKIMATMDALTGVKNRLSLDEALDLELKKVERYKREFSIILTDLDNFKDINDTQGHQAGDIILQEIAHIMQTSIRDSDIFGRWGGEEFLIICPETDSEGAATVAEHLRSRIEQATFPSLAKVTASFGVASYTPGDKAKMLIRRADQALYEAKDCGRNMVRIAQPPQPTRTDCDEN